MKCKKWIKINKFRLMVSYNDNFVLFPAHFGTIKWVFAGILTFGGGILYEEDSLNSHLS